MKLITDYDPYNLPRYPECELHGENSEPEGAVPFWYEDVEDWRRL